jgi:outer membrane protein assembly factor BamA
MMTWRFYPVIVGLFLLLFHSFLYAEQSTILKTEARFDIEQDKALEFSINNYLLRFLQLHATEENRATAENFLNSSYFVSKAHCHYAEYQNGKNLFCEIKTKRVIRNIIILNLPAALLESELKNKLPIQVGHSISVDETLKETLTLMKARVETFLRKNGYYHAEVNLVENFSDDSPLIDIIVEIKDGAFARVNEVTVHGDPPISTRVIKKLFTRMCFRFDKIIESISMGTFSCYSRELERETTQALQERFAKIGYVQARIRIDHHWVDPNDATTEKYCQKKSKDDSTTRCVNLRVDIEKGPMVRWTINVKDQIAISRNAFLRFLGSLFSVTQFSRATVAPESDEVALDYQIIKEELLDQITFVSSKNVDEQEINESATEITNFFVSRGYTNAEVIPHILQENASNLVVTFDVYAGKPYFINSVRLLPEKYLAYIGKEDLETLVEIRSITHNGHLSFVEIDTAREEIEHRLNAQGFENLKVKTDLVSKSNGGVDIVYYVEGKNRERIDEVIILNGYRELNEEILPLLYNCNNYERPRRYDQQRKLCHNSSLVRSKLEDDSIRITDSYKTHGFLYAKVNSKVTKTQFGYKVIFNIYDSRFGESSLMPLKKQEIKDIIISGNSSTSARVIKRLFPKDRKSRTLDPIGLKKGLANLREIGSFSRIDHKIMAEQEGSDDVYFLLQLVEKPSLSIDTSAAFSTDKYFSLETELEETNLFSSMLRLNTSLGLGLFWGRQSIFSNRLVWPFILGKQVRLIVHAPRIVYDDFSHRADPNRRLQSKVSFALEWRFSTTITPYLRYWLVLNQVDKSPPAPNFQERLRSLDGLIPTIQTPGKLIAVLNPGISYIQLDNPFDPRSGLDINLWTELSGMPFGESPFINLGNQNRFFIPLGPLTLALRANFMRAFIEPNAKNWDELKNASLVMDNLGGDRSIRGYEEGKIGITTGVVLPGRYAGYFSYIANVELRFPITTKYTTGNFSGALFVDQGMAIPCSSLFRCLENKPIKSIVKENGFGLSLGTALRYMLPVGPISLDYGISPLTGDSRVHVLFGYAF